VPDIQNTLKITPDARKINPKTEKRLEKNGSPTIVFRKKILFIIAFFIGTDYIIGSFS